MNLMLFMPIPKIKFAEVAQDNNKVDAYVKKFSKVIAFLFVSLSFASCITIDNGPKMHVVSVDESAMKEVNRAKNLLRLGEVSEGIAVLEKVVAASLNSNTGHKAGLLLIEWYLRQGQSVQAKKLTKNILLKYPGSNFAKQARYTFEKFRKIPPLVTSVRVSTKSTMSPSGTNLSPSSLDLSSSGLPREPIPELKMGPRGKPEDDKLKGENDKIAGGAVNGNMPETINAQSLGVILPLSGPYEQYGRRSLTAIMLAFGIPAQTESEKVDSKEIFTAAIGKITLVIADSAGDVKVAEKMIDEIVSKHKVIGIIGDILIDTSEAVAKKCESYSVPLIALSRKPDITKNRKFVLRLGLTSNKQAKALVSRAMEKLGVKKFAILYPKHAYGTEMANAFAAEVKAHNATLTNMEAYDADETTFTDVVKKIAARQHGGAAYAQCKAKANAITNAYRKKKALMLCVNSVPPSVDFEALFIPDFAKTISYIVPALVAGDVLVSKNENVIASYRRTTKFLDTNPVNLLGGNSWHDQMLGDRLKNHIEGALFLDAIDLKSEDAVVKEFVDKFTAQRGDSPTLIEAQSYDSARIMLSILDKENGPNSRTELRDRLFALKDFASTGGPLSFLENGESLVPLHWFSFDSGNIIALGE